MGVPCLKICSWFSFSSHVPALLSHWWLFGTWGSYLSTLWWTLIAVAGVSLPYWWQWSHYSYPLSCAIDRLFTLTLSMCARRTWPGTPSSQIGFSKKTNLAWIQDWHSSSPLGWPISPFCLYLMSTCVLWLAYALKEPHQPALVWPDWSWFCLVPHSLTWLSRALSSEPQGSESTLYWVVCSHLSHQEATLGAAPCFHYQNKILILIIAAFLIHFI